MDIANQPYIIALMISAVFGILSFLSPCVLPIVPSYLAYMSGVSYDEVQSPNRRKTIIISAVYFVIGLSTAFLLLALGYYGFAKNAYFNQSIFNFISGTIIIIFGLHFLGIFRIGFLMREMRVQADHNQSPLAAYILGLAFALGWSPCLGPALGAILSLTATQATLLNGLGLMVAYAAGLGVPFIISALLIDRFIQKSANLRRYMPMVEKIMGALLVIVGIMMITGQFTSFANWLNNSFPILQEFG